MKAIQLLNYTKQCKLIKSSSHTEECSHFYFKNYNGTCILYELIFAASLWYNVLMSAIDSHYGVQKINQMPKYKPKLSCQPINDFSSLFYEISDICSYKLDKHGHLVPCKKGEHLQNCEMFECNMMLKCPNFYCIPWGYICYGKWDCPSGYDESILHQCRNRTCINMFKCKLSSICLHLGDVCNGFVDCPHEDDEFSCLLKFVICPSVCQCLGFAIRCYYTHFSEHNMPVYFPYSFVTILNCTLFAESQLQKKNPICNNYIYY